MKRTLFMHVPRTAGNSIVRRAERCAPSYQCIRVNRHDESSTNFDPSIMFTSAWHRSVKYLVRKNIFTKEWVEDCYRFAFVRNPWDRLASTYRNVLHRLNRTSSVSTNMHLANFTVYVRMIASGKLSGNINRLVTRPRFDAATPQTEWLKWGMDFVGRFENLDADWEKLCGIIGMRHEPLAVVGATDHGKPWRDYYTEETRKLAAEYYAEEIERFGYTFD